MAYDNNGEPDVGAAETLAQLPVASQPAVCCTQAANQRWIDPLSDAGGCIHIQCSWHYQ